MTLCGYKHRLPLKRSAAVRTSLLNLGMPCCCVTSLACYPGASPAPDPDLYSVFASNLKNGALAYIYDPFLHLGRSKYRQKEKRIKIFELGGGEAGWNKSLKKQGNSTKKTHGYGRAHSRTTVFMQFWQRCHQHFFKWQIEKHCTSFIFIHCAWRLFSMSSVFGISTSHQRMRFSRRNDNGERESVTVSRQRVAGPS